ncbi:transposon Tf2-9 polyprotein [Nephila pilipes]|uniref:Transposon Tf2-9 polyprotein n=1 Tax=Nephila pilipes TaxID=299642 RepID=A0A8X6UBK7_NEPPI|nr:transposon Tf2-9 polyprotein [Nephila pilipes]
MSAERTARALMHDWISRFGCPVAITTDQALKEDIKAACSQLVNGTTIRLPSDLVSSGSIDQTSNLTNVTNLIQAMRFLGLVSTAHHGSSKF